MKRLISTLLCIALVLSICGTAIAAEPNTASNAIRIVDRTSTIVFHHQDTSAYNTYKVQLPAEDSSEEKSSSLSTINARDFVLSLCTLAEYEQIGDIDTYSYNSDTLKEYIYNCAEITSISKMNDSLYIGYTTTGEEEVILRYDAEGFDHVTIYNPEYDRATIVQADRITRYEHFREGKHFEMSDELLSKIDTCLQEDDFDALLAIKEIKVTTDSTGAIWIEPSPSVMQASSNTTDEARNLQQLMQDFPPYTDAVKYTNSMYSTELGQRFSVTVKENRDSYTKKSANWQLFSVGTALSLIGLFIGLDPQIAAVVVTALGIGISATDTILQQVSLCQNAVYKYKGERRGYVYDTITYQQNVRVIWHVGTGEFHGVYDKNGNFVWGVFSAPSAYSHTYADIAKKSFDNYCADIVMNHYCSLYYPD